MITSDLLKYGITNVGKVMYNPTYEEMFKAEMDERNEGSQPLANQDSPVYQPGPAPDSPRSCLAFSDRQLGCDNGGRKGLSFPSGCGGGWSDPAARRHQRPVSQTR